MTNNRSTTPPNFNLVGLAGGTPDPLGEFVVVVRSASDVPVCSVPVTIDLSGCTGSVRLAGTQPHPGLGVDCVARTVSTMTGCGAEAGIARFRIVGRGVSPASCGPTGPSACAVIRVYDYVLATVRVGAYDMNGAGGVSPSDLSAFLSDLFQCPSSGRSDLTGNGTISAADLSLMMRALFGGGSTESGIPCP